MPPKQFIGSADAAKTLGIDRSTLNRWIRAGKLSPVARLSDAPMSAHLFDRAAVEALASTRRAS